MMWNLNRKRLLTIIAVIAFVISMVFGTATVVQASADSAIAKQIETSVQAIIAKHGFPAIKNGRDYLTAKEVMELRDRANFATFTYMKDRNGEYHCLAQSLGYPMPASVQIANPRRDIGYAASLPQAEANGLFIPQGLSATYQRIIDPATGQKTLGYFEIDIAVYPFEIPWAKTRCVTVKPAS